MSSLVKATVLSLGLVAGAAFAVQAQTSDNLSSLPPGGASTAGPSVIAPSGNYPGPAPGGGNAAVETPTQGAVVATGNYPGPAPGASNGPVPPRFNKSTGYDSDRNMAPYTAAGMGPKPN